MFYAQKTPRGFSNEVMTYQFATAENRDLFIANNQRDRPERSARAATKKEALSACAKSGTRNGWGEASYNSQLINGDQELIDAKQYADYCTMMAGFRDDLAWANGEKV